MTATLESVAAEVRAARLEPPVVTVVGDVVAMRGAKRFFDDVIDHAESKQVA